MKSYSIILFLGGMLLLAGCKGSRKITDEGLLKTKEAKTVLKKVQQQNPDFDFISGKGKVGFRDKRLSVRGTYNLRWKRDEFIWMNLKKFSIEGARILIRPDSIFAIDRINREYYAESFEFAQRFLGMPISFEQVQQLLLGEGLWMDQTESYSADVLDQQYRLRTESEGIERAYLIDPDEYYLNNTQLKQAEEKRYLEIKQEGYRKIKGDNPFAYIRKVFANSSETGEVSIDLEFTSLEVDQPTAIRFDIPDNYRRAR